ncbi:GxxExxY protein [bacterium]|nr:MAG: GxxExxY protein [bacterium]
MATNKNQSVSTKVIFPELSYVITGVLFSVHNELGSYETEKHYGNAVEKKLKEIKLPYSREVRISGSGNIPDFIIDSRIALELKCVRQLTGENYRQIQNYLQQTNLKLGILVNFRSKYLKPARIIRIDSHNS